MPAVKVGDTDIYGLGDEYFEAYCHRKRERTCMRAVTIDAAKMFILTYFSR